MNTKIIKFDLNKNLYDTLIAKQGDTKSRFLLFNLLDGSIPFSLENRSVRVYAIKPDGTEIFNDLIITDAAKGYCILELTTQMLAVAGTVKLELMVIEDEKKLTSNIFYMDVKKSINSEKAVVSTNEFGALLTALSSLNEYDNYKKEIAAARDGEANLLTKVKKIDEQLEQIHTYNVLNDELFDIDDISKSINKIVKNLNEGDTVFLPNGVYGIKSPILLTDLKNGVTIDLQGEIIQKNSIESAIIVSGAYYKLNINKLTGLIPNSDFSNLVTNGIKIGSNNSYQGNININILSGFKNGILCNPTKKDGVAQGIQYNKINFNIIANCETCIKFDLVKDEGWVNENTFIGGSINGVKGIEFTGGNDSPATGYNNNKFYNIGFEGLKGDAITIQNSNGNSWVNCRMLESIDGEYFIKENSNCNWNLFIFSGLLPYEKLKIDGKLDRIIAPISINGAWLCNGFHVIKGIKHFDVSSEYNLVDRNEKKLIDINCGIIQVSSYNNEVSFTIPNNFQLEGKEITLKVTYKNPITIFNEDGVEIVSNSVINCSGVWKLYYMNNVWHCYRTDFNVLKMEALYSSASTIETLSSDFNKLLSSLKKVGLMNY